MLQNKISNNSKIKLNEFIQKCHLTISAYIEL